MRVIFFAGSMPDLSGAFFHDIDLGTELKRRGHDVMFLTVKVPKEGYNGGYYRGFRFMHFTAAGDYLDLSEIWLCPHMPALPHVRALNYKYNRPIIFTCHYDGNYQAITKNNPGRDIRWVEMAMFVNNVMENTYRNNVVPWPPNLIKTHVVRPIMHESKFRITEPFQGEYITLVNANANKGVSEFVEIARRMPNHKFLGVLAYYGDIPVILKVDLPPNIKWIPFNDDIREVLKETRILLMPSYYESYGRVAFEAMYNGIPVIYTKPIVTSIYPGGSTEGVREWIGDAAIACDRSKPEEWIESIEYFDNPDVYSLQSAKCKQHIQNMNMFSEASKISQVVEQFSREHPVVIKKTFQEPIAQGPQVVATPFGRAPQGQAPQIGFSNGRLRIRR